MNNSLIPNESEVVFQAMWDGNPLILVEGCPGSGLTNIGIYGAALGAIDGLVIFVVQNSDSINYLLPRFKSLFPKLKIASSCKDTEGVFICTVDFLLKENFDSSFKASWLIIDNADIISDSFFGLLSPLANRFLLLFSSLYLNKSLNIFENSNKINESLLNSFISRKWLKPLLVSLSISHRLPEDTSEILSPFISRIPFTSSSFYPFRSIVLPYTFDLKSELDRAISLVASGISLVNCSFLNTTITTYSNKSLPVLMKSFVDKFINSGLNLTISGTERPISSSDILIIVPDKIYLDILNKLFENYNITICIYDNISESRPISLLLDVISNDLLYERAKFLSNSLCYHEICSFIFSDNKSKLVVPKSSIYFENKDLLWNSYLFISGFEKSFSSNQRRVRFFE